MSKQNKVDTSKVIGTIIGLGIVFTLTVLKLSGVYHILVGEVKTGLGMVLISLVVWIALGTMVSKAK